MGALYILLGVAVAVALALASGWLFRTLLLAVTRGESRRVSASAPLTASFGMLVILLYILIAFLARHNPIAIIVPCHRVIAKSGDLQGYFYGLDMKRKLLELENPMSFGEQGSLF